MTGYSWQFPADQREKFKRMLRQFEISSRGIVLTQDGDKITAYSITGQNYSLINGIVKRLGGRSLVV